MNQKNNMQIWNQLCVTDKKFTKKISGKQFKGDSINPTYIKRKLTEVFGPCGMFWGTNVIKDQIIDGALESNHDGSISTICKIHVLDIELWYRETLDGPIFKVEGHGTTKVTGVNKNGSYTDDEFYKKTKTDAITNAAVMLGSSADIFLGIFDNKYQDDDNEKGNGIPVKLTYKKVVGGKKEEALKRADEEPASKTEEQKKKFTVKIGGQKSEPTSEPKKEETKKVEPLVLKKKGELSEDEMRKSIHKWLMEIYEDEYENKLKELTKYKDVPGKNNIEDVKIGQLKFIFPLVKKEYDSFIEFIKENDGVLPEINPPEPELGDPGPQEEPGDMI